MKRHKDRTVAEMDQALEEDPPVIRWESNGKGILVGTVIRDPYAERSWNKHSPESDD